MVDDPRDADLILILMWRGCCNVTQITNKSGLGRHTVERHLARLEKEGKVRKEIGCEKGSM